MCMKMENISAIKKKRWSVMAAIAAIKEKTKDKTVGNRIADRIGCFLFEKVEYYLILLPGALSYLFKPTPFAEFCVYAAGFLPFIAVAAFLLLRMLAEVIDAFMGIIFGFFDLFGSSDEKIDF